MHMTLFLTTALAAALPAVPAQDPDFPPASSFSLAEAEAAVKRFAIEARFESAQFSAASDKAVPYEDGRPSPVWRRSLEITGRETYETVDRFLGLLGDSPRPIEVQTLRLTAAASHTVAFQARIAFLVVGPKNASEPRELARLLAGLREQSTSSHFTARSLASFTTWAADDAVALTDVLSEGQTTFLTGITLGSAAQDSLERALGAGGFVVLDIKSLPRGRCQVFTTLAQPTIFSRSEKPVPTNGLFDDQTGRVCEAPPRKATARIEARGTGGPVTARMRDVDLADVVHVVSEATHQGFVVDPDVTLVVDADLADATAEQVIESMQRAGLSVGPGPLRRISAAGKRIPVPAAQSTHSGKTLSIAVKRAPIGDFLCLLKDFAGTAILTPRGLEGQISMFATDVPWDQLLDAGAASLGLTFVNAKGKQRAFLGPEAAARAAQHPDAVEPCRQAADESFRKWSQRPPTTGILNMRDLRLAGFAKIEGKWTGYTYGPFSDTLLPLAPGYALLDGDVVAAGPASVTVETSDKKRVELKLP